MIYLPKHISRLWISVRFLIVWIFISISPSHVTAQHLSFRNFSVREGISQSQINDIVQDNEGFIWFATAEGLTRFDGKNFTNYSKIDGLASTFITKMILDSAGNIWLGHRTTGLTKINRNDKKFRIIPFPEQIRNAMISDMIEEKSGVLWFATERHGLIRYENDSLKVYNKLNGLPNEALSDFCKYQDRLLVGSTTGIIQIIPDSLKGFVFPPFESQHKSLTRPVNFLLCDRNNHLWIGSDNREVLLYQPAIPNHSPEKIERISNNLGLGNVLGRCAYEDSQGKIWIGTSDRGLIMYTAAGPGQVNPDILLIDKKNGLTREDITKIFEDREGSMWFGTNGGGAFQFQGKCFEQYGREEGLLDDFIWAVHEDVFGEYWFGSEKGLTRVSKMDVVDWEKSVQFYTEKNWGGNATILDLESDRFGNIWMVVYGSGIRKFNRKTGKFIKYAALEDKNIICMEKDQSQNLWFGSFYNGVFRLDLKTGKIDNFTMKDGLSSNTIFKILKSGEKELWFTTVGGGLSYFDGTHFHKITKEQGNPAETVLSIAEDSKGTLWIGSEGDGLFKYDRNVFENISKKYQSWEGDIYSLMCDAQDKLWIGTRRGIEKFDPITGEVKKYGEYEGFTAIETNQNAEYMDSRGNLWFGTIQGAIRYNPEEDIKNTVPPLTLIRNIQVYLQDHPLPQDNRFGTKENFLTFNFTGLSFVVPENIRYSYKLEGLDQAWSPLTAEVYATYANLDPGEYVFKVKSINSDNIWSDTAATYAFTIASPFWQKAWFFLLVILGLAGSVYGAYRYRIRKIYRNNLQLEKMVRARTKDLVDAKEKTLSAYNALLETEKKLKQVTESINAYLWSMKFDQKGDLIDSFITDNYYHLLGYSAADFQEINNHYDLLFKITHPDDLSILKQSLESARNGNEVNITYRIRLKSGNLRWVYDNAIPVKDDNGKVRQIHGVGIDITNRKLAEEALRKSEEKYATFMRFSTEAIWSMDLKEPMRVDIPIEEQVDAVLANAYISDCNDAMAEMYGYQSASEIIGIPLSRGLLRDNSENRKHIRDFVTSNYRMKNAEFMERDRHGNIRVMLVSFVGIIEGGLLTRSWGMQQDITEHKKAEESLRESEEMYRRLIERSPDAIFVHSEGLIDYVNQAGLKMFGAKEVGDLNGKKLITLSHPDYHEMGLKRIEQIYREKKEIGLIEQKMIRLDGSEFDVEVMGAPVIYKGKASGQSIVRDITARKRMESEIQKGQKLESVGILAGGIAHDFNNILTAILGNISMARMYSPTGGEAAAVLSDAERATLQAKDLTQQLLTFSKGGAPVKETTSIFEIIKESTSFVLRGSKIEPEYVCPQNVWHVDVDAAQMSQVIQNLIINAEQAMPEGKRIRISLENVEFKKNEIPGLKKGKFVRIKIIDQGIGIKKDHLNKIFDPYFTTKQKGSGLGLATAYSIIKRHEGHIGVKSDIGKGTEMILYLPASTLQNPPQKKEVEVLQNGNGRILVMDDEEMLRDLANQFLSHLGYQVDTVADGEAAVESYTKALQLGKPYSLVIMDLTIPGGMGGKETIEQLTQIDADVKAIVSSGYSNDPVLAKFKEYGFKAVLAKPYKIESLSTTIASVLGTNS